jgi:hypothetical protein
LKVVEEGVQAKVADDSANNGSGVAARTPAKDELKSRPVTTASKKEVARQVPTGLSRKFFGIPVWLYLGFGLFIGAIFVIAAIAR